AFDALLHLYERTLKVALGHPLIVMLASAVILVLTVVFFLRVPKGLFPSEDTGRLLVSTQGLESASFEDMARHQQQLAAIVQADPNVESLMSSVGARGATGANSGTLFIRLKP